MTENKYDNKYDNKYENKHENEHVNEQIEKNNTNDKKCIYGTYCHMFIRATEGHYYSKKDDNMCKLDTDHCKKFVHLHIPLNHYPHVNEQIFLGNK